MEWLGFDSTRLTFCLRTAVGAWLAVLMAWLMGLEHPQWSGMTVWATSQPLRGHLIEKSLFRIIGTFFGVLVGTFLLVASQGEPWSIVVGLAVWIGLCAAAGSLLQGFVSYGAVTAGYSAAMVALLQSAEVAHPFAVGLDRMLTVVVGIGVALVVGWAFAAESDLDSAHVKVRDLSRRLLDDLKAQMTGRPFERAEQLALLSDMASIEDELEGKAAGSLRARQGVKAIRAHMIALVGLIVGMRAQSPLVVDHVVVTTLADASQALHEPYRPDLAEAALRQAARVVPDRMVHVGLVEFADAIAWDMRYERPNGGTEPVVVLHRDWIGARQTLLRTAGVILTAGGIWLVTKWEGGAFMLLGTTVMLTVFAATEKPTAMLRHALVGQFVAVLAALTCRWLVWPLVDEEIWPVLGMMPFILAGGLFFAHRRTAGPAFDYNMVVMLMLQPSWPLSGTLSHSLTLGLAIILGPAIALVGFLVLFPVNVERRMRALAGTIVHDVESIAAGARVSGRHVVWRARLYHRVLRLVRLADKMGGNRDNAVECSLALLLAGYAALHLDAAVREPGLQPETARWVTVALGRLRNLRREPEDAAQAMRVISERIAADARVDAELLRKTGHALCLNASSIRRMGDRTSTT